MSKGKDVVVEALEQGDSNHIEAIEILGVIDVSFEVRDYDEMVEDFMGMCGYSEDEAREAAGKVLEQDCAT